VPNKDAKLTKLEALLQAAVDAIISIDSEGSIENVNMAAEKLFGYESAELIGKNVNILMPESWAAEHQGYLQRYLKTGEKKILGIGREVKGKNKEGRSFPIHLSISEFQSGGKRFFTGIIHDLSRRRKIENALLQAQKMEALGQLTGGIAHDFNNLLTIITGNLELLDVHLKDELQRDLLKEALEAADLGAELTNRLLAFAKRSVLEPKNIDLNQTIIGLVKLMKRTLGAKVVIETRFSKDLWLSLVDPAPLESALINLAVNARDAMPDGGTLMLETSNQAIDEGYAAQEGGLQVGDYVRVSVSDSGAGMAPDVLAHVFEPFFTTKTLGEGTGLGLSMVHGFAEQSGGQCTIYSEPGMGTTVNIYLPRHYGSDAEQQKTVARHEVLETAGTSNLVLVVEDDPKVRALSQQRLEALGYETLLASSGDEALEILDRYASSEKKISLVFTDLVMPGKANGYELAKQVRANFPDINVLLTSGYAEDLIHSGTLEKLDIQLLRKPYRQADLATAIALAIRGQTRG